MTGILLLDKPSGISSAQAIARVKRVLGAKKIGHAGTLDPMATGLLVCLLGSATRLASFAEKGLKTYSGEILFGVVTDSDDVTGAVLTTSPSRPDFGSIESAIGQFVGTIEQVPPQISAVKVDGERAYRLARAGEEVALRARTCTISNLECWPAQDERGVKVGFRLTCTSGTYIRSLARDLGAALGCGGCLASLRREASFPFRVSDAVTLDELSAEAIADWRGLFPDARNIVVPPTEAARLMIGDQAALLQLAALHLRCDGEAGSLADSRAIYSDSVSGRGLGLLVRKDDRWSFGVNVSDR